MRAVSRVRAYDCRRQHQRTSGSFTEGGIDKPTRHGREDLAVGAKGGSAVQNPQRQDQTAETRREQQRAHGHESGTEVSDGRQEDHRAADKAQQRGATQRGQRLRAEVSISSRRNHHAHEQERPYGHRQNRGCQQEHASQCRAPPRRLAVREHLVGRWQDDTSLVRRDVPPEFLA